MSISIALKIEYAHHTPTGIIHIPNVECTDLWIKSLTELKEILFFPFFLQIMYKVLLTIFEEETPQRFFHLCFILSEITHTFLRN